MTRRNEGASEALEPLERWTTVPSPTATESGLIEDGSSVDDSTDSIDQAVEAEILRHLILLSTLHLDLCHRWQNLVTSWFLTLAS